jgi:putative NADH-flavin reductase
MRLAIFGGTGHVGELVVDQALAAGHQLQVFVRDRTRIVPANRQLRVFEGTLDDGETVAATLQDTDAAICALSAGNDVLTRFAEAAVPLMQDSGPRRIVALAGASLRMPDDPKSFRLDLMTFLMRLIPGRMIDDASTLARQLAASDLDWTIVRSANFSDTPGTGRVRAQAGYEMSLRASIPRADVAAFLLAAAAEGRFLREAPMIEAV